MLASENAFFCLPVGYLLPSDQKSGPVAGHLPFLESGETSGPIFFPERSGMLF